MNIVNNLCFDKILVHESMLSDHTPEKYLLIIGFGSEANEDLQLRGGETQI